MMECLNVSSLWGLPIVFVCEHNQFCEFTRAEQVTSGQIADRARAFKIHTQWWMGTTSRPCGMRRRKPWRARAR